MFAVDDGFLPFPYLEMITLPLLMKDSFAGNKTLGKWTLFLLLSFQSTAPFFFLPTCIAICTSFLVLTGWRVQVWHWKFRCAHQWAEKQGTLTDSGTRPHSALLWD